MGPGPPGRFDSSGISLRIGIVRLVYTDRMKFVFASDSFKGSLTSGEICTLLARAARAAFPAAECVPLLIADGGEGTLDAIAEVVDGERVSVEAHDGLMRPLVCDVLASGSEAFVESAASCGLAKLSPGERNPLAASSYGVGECIRYALDAGYGSITVGLGGSCTNDGGTGCLRALGVRFLDARGAELSGSGAELARIARIDESDLHPAVARTRFTIMGDVANPLLGPNGATYVFGRQKGADDAAAAQLEAGMERYAEAVSAVHPEADFNTPGFGAAGGLGMALAVFLGASIRPGIEELLRWLDFDTLIQGADLVVTGEGRVDGQSVQGKAIDGIARHARDAGVPVALVCGTNALDEERLRSLGISRIVEIAAGQETEYALAHARRNYARAARSLFASLRGEFPR